ncbi:MAG: alpha-L-fucosidase [Bacteroidota bacterium]
MYLNKNVKHLLVCLLIANAFSVQAQQLPINNGPFKPTDESLKTYKYPEWFRDVKFGIWAHWGPQAVPRQGDWYARGMYEQGSRQNKYHVAHYGHPSKFGYKDIIPLWKAEKWDPEKLMALYKRAGAKYFVSMGSHHDNFFLWKSNLNKWNSVNMGPKKDVVGIWQKAAKKEGLKFGVSEHLAASYTWFQVAHGADKNGDLQGVPYDGAGAQYADLYHTKAAKGDNAWLTTNPEYMKQWYTTVKELVDNYHPDLLYSDSKLPFDEVGRSMLANFYNGNPNSVYNCKEPSNGKWVEDLERGVQSEINPFPWQTDTSIGDWYYQTGQKYKTGKEVIQMLIDIVSKNGNLLINVVQTPEGDLEADVLNILEYIAAWMPANGKGIYGTRPWKIYGEGPSTDKANQKKGQFAGNNDVGNYKPGDFRFTSKGNNLYAFCMEVPAGDIQIKSLGKNSAVNDKKIASVSLLGSKQKLKWKQEDDMLVISKPTDLTGKDILGLQIQLK